MNEYEGITWFNKEFFEDFIAGLFVVSILEILRNIDKVSERKKELKSRYSIISNLLICAQKAEYSVDRFMKEIKKHSM
jgi:hypothetical protein